MECRTPNITLATHQMVPTQPRPVEVQFHLDGVPPKNYDFNYYLDPALYKFDGANHVRYLYKDEAYLRILVRIWMIKNDQLCVLWMYCGYDKIIYLGW